MREMCERPAVTGRRSLRATSVGGAVLPSACLAAVLTAGCTEGGGPGANATVRTDSAGVTIATHHGPEIPAGLVFVEELRLGGSETRPEESFFQVDAGVVGVDDVGRIHVLDTSGNRVVVFDADGRHLRTLGRAGQGPGEIGVPGGLAVSPDGHVAVADFSRRGFVRWDPEGQPLPAMPFPPGFSGGLIHVAGETLVLPVQRDGGTALSLIRILGPDTVWIAELPAVEMRPIRLASCGMSFSGMPPVFSPTLRWHARGDRTAAATSADYDVVVFEGEASVLRVRRDLAPRTATERSAIEKQGDGMRVRLEGGVVVCDPAEVVEQRGFEPLIPLIRSVVIAPDGILWVQREGPGDEGGAVDRFSPNGDYLGTLPEGSPFPIVFLTGDRIAAAQTDDLGVTRLVVYRVDRG